MVRDMKTIKFLLKLITILTFYILIYGFSYALYINKTGNNINLIIPLIFNGIGFLILGFGYGNHFQKKGLIIGLLVSLVHFFLLKIIYYFASNKFDINALGICIIILLGGIGGLIGGNIKKIF